ncbi:MAG TPA: DNA-binding response regulator, partial [Vibrio sp.]|nr:DNA-binding response regulator [Vibrio sp.]
MKILVVEDEPRLGQQILETLEGADWVPELSQDGID